MERQIDSNFPQLFSEIRKHKSLKKDMEHKGNYEKDGKINLTLLYKAQDEVWNSLHYSNSLLGECVEETQVIIEFQSKS